MTKRCVLSIDHAADFVSKGRSLELKALADFTSIDDDAAAMLGKIRVDRLWFEGLTSLTPVAAKGLAGYKGSWLFLDGLTEISDETAAALGRCKAGYLSLDGLTNISTGAAAGLGKLRNCSLSLNGLTNLSVGAASALSAMSGHDLSLHGLISLESGAARALSKVKVNKLDLTGIKELSEEEAAGLSRFTGQELWLLNLSAMSDEVARELAKFKGSELQLYGEAERIFHETCALINSTESGIASGPLELKKKPKKNREAGSRKEAPIPSSQSSIATVNKSKAACKVDGCKVKRLKLSFWIEGVYFPAPDLDVVLPSELLEARKSYRRNVSAAQKKYSNALADFIRADLIIDSIDGGDELFENTLDIAACELKIKGFDFEESCIPSCAVLASFIVPIKIDGAIGVMNIGEWYDLLDERGIGFALSLAWSMELPNGETWTAVYESHQGFEWEVSFDDN